METQTKQQIIPLGKDLTYLQAWEVTKGNLPSNVLHDEYLVMSDKWKEPDRSYYTAWARKLDQFA
jgi:hypothetical protein